MIDFDPMDIKPPRRVRINMVLDIDLDSVPGFGYKTEHFVDHVKDHFNLAMGHYRPILNVNSVEDIEVLDKEEED